MASKIIVTLTVALLLISAASLWIALSQPSASATAVGYGKVMAFVEGLNGLPTAVPSSTTGKVVVNVVSAK